MKFKSLLIVLALSLTSNYALSVVRSYCQPDIDKDDCVVVKFSTTSCGPCRTLAPKFSQLSNEPEFSNIKFMEVKDDYKLMQKYNVRSVPTCLVFKKGKIQDRITGFAGNNTLNQIRSAIRTNKSKNCIKK